MRPAIEAGLMLLDKVANLYMQQLLAVQAHAPVGANSLSDQYQWLLHKKSPSRKRGLFSEAPKSATDSTYIAIESGHP